MSLGADVKEGRAKVEYDCARVRLKPFLHALHPVLSCRSVLFAASSSSVLLLLCQRDPFALAMRHIQNGDKNIEQKKYPEAILEYRMATSLVDVSTIAHYRLAERT